ncbi:tetratricopeptide repeat protein, partial [Myxococcota bacterium]|nr:tetratricopeptide repeat protein [Myxococcota bacterium]
YARIGTIEKEYLVRADNAISAFENVLRLSVGDAEALEALEILYTQGEMWTNTIRIIEEKLKIAPTGERKIELLLQIAALWENRLSGLDEAAEAFARILKINHLHQEAYENIERLYTAREHWKELSEVYLDRHSALGGNNEDLSSIPKDHIEEIVLGLQKLAAVMEDKMNDRKQAFEVLAMAFDFDPTNDETARRLERITDIDDTWEELITMYEETAEAIDDRKVKCDLLTKTGSWYCEKLDDVEKATAVLRTALKHDPNHGGVHLALADVHKINNSISEYIEELKKALEVESRTELRFKAAMELARVHEKDFGDFHEAVRFFKVAHEAEPEKPEPMQALERLLAETENWRELINLLWEKVEQSQDEEEIIDLKIRIAELYDDRREAPSKAVEVLTTILETNPDHLPTMRFLERLYDKIGDMEEFLALLERQMEYISNDEEMVMKYHQMAAVWEEHYEKVDKSIECYEAILEISGTDEGAYRNLARLYRQEKKWTEYIDVLYRHIGSTFDPGEKVRLYKAAALILEKQLNEPERAIDCYASILDEEENDLEALSALSRLYEAAEEWDKSLRVSQRLVNLVDEPHERVELYHRIGKISEEHLMDLDEAERLYAEAMAINPSFVPALRDLSRIYEGRGDWIKASRLLETAQQHTVNVVDKAAYLYDGGVIYLDHLEEYDRAADLFEQCLELDPEHVNAAMRYVDILWQRENYGEAFPHLQMLVRKLKSQDTDREVMVKVNFRYGKSSQAKGDLDRALKAYNDAFELEKTSLPILMGLASTYYSLEKWDDAFNKYKQILVHLQNSEDEALHTEIYYNLGNIRFKQHDVRRALNLYEKALEMDKNHVPTLEAMIELHEHERNYKAAADIKEQIIEATFDMATKVDLLSKLGEYQRDKVKDDKKAIDAYNMAHELDPDNTILIHELIELYQTTEQWKKVVRLMKILAEKESDPMVRSKYHYSVGGIYRSFINSPDEAIEYYNLVLDDDHNNLKAFQYIDKILTSRKDWTLQERNYRKMLKRVMEKDPDNKGLIVTLFHALGEIYRTRIGDFHKAMQSFENAVQMAPGDQNRDEILAELYFLAGPDTYDKAIIKHQEILERNPFNMESLKSLYKLYYEMSQYDKAWCIASALTHAKVAEAEEIGFYKQYKPLRVKQLKGNFSDDIWNRFLISEDEDIFLRNILASISMPISMVKGRQFKDYGLDRRRRSERTTDGPIFEKMFFYVLDYMGVEYPELYILGDRRGGLGHNIALDKGQRVPIVTVGQDLLQGHLDSALAFIIARELTYLRPEHYLTKLVGSTGEFVGLVFGAIRMVNQTMPLPGDANVLNQSAAQLAGLVPDQSKQYLTTIVQRMAQANYVPDITKYLQAIEISSHRAGLTIVQDLDVAMGVVKSEPMLPGGLGAKQKADALFRFATSEKYFELRKIFSVRIEDN